MSNSLGGKKQKDNLSRPGCFRSEFLKVCPGLLKDSFRRNHGTYVKNGQLLEGIDFIRIRDTPGLTKLYDPVFYFESAIDLFQERWGNQVHKDYLQLKTLSELGFEVSGNDVVKRKQLKLQFCPSDQPQCHGLRSSNVNDIEDANVSSQENLENIERLVRHYFEEGLKEIKNLIDFYHLKIENSIRGFEYRCEAERAKERFITSLTNKIKESKISSNIWKPLYAWEKLLNRPIGSLHNKHPFVYIIICCRRHTFKEEWEVFYVGKSSQENSERFNKHDALTALESNNYLYEIYYFESYDFRKHQFINRVEKGLQVVLEPYWELLTPKQHRLIKEGKFVSGEVFQGFPNRNDVNCAS